LSKNFGMTSLIG